ncbi:D-(-)-3-hydroxybutyrate oligomer hydrolase [Zoogloea sp.]|uniref:D-(-)-3-hydroxybutyrate oligomer hydrolase n=1 Tax=Zoogloea sp. TaxID=49181 RepID=UPI0025DBFFBC|nr:D-(-)-3-hydroxybutyrate oligomer hydrolase [Zoogloea sp.]MCK6392856.1 D-(-)-3-hydroxybutyrate oligomer hydrolase [Zoogloea sp.]
MEYRFRLKAVVLAVSGALLLSACGGSGNGSDKGIQLSGIAAEGLAIANGTVTIKDKTGQTRSATTDSNGNYTVQTIGLTYPLMLQITGSQGVWHALITEDDAGKSANINNATNSIAQLALGLSSDAALRSAFATGTFSQVGAASVASADAKLLDALEAELGKRPASLRHAKFQPGTASTDGDETDRLLTLVDLRPSGTGFIAYNRRPERIRADSYRIQDYDGSSDDLLTAGLGKTGLGSATAPAYTNAAAPTVAELRRNAIYNNYRALVDANKPSGGYGTLYGPNIDTQGGDTLGEGKIAGTEAIAFSGDESGTRLVTVMVQIPASFNAAQPCIVTATSSGSRGIYGAIGTAGEWGLKHGCAVAYTDKGSGNGMHDLAKDTVNLIDGTVSSASAAGKRAHFAADLSKSQLDAFNTAFPNRIAYKHAHSRQNPEKDWGRNTLDAVGFAFYVLNEKFGTADASGKKPRAIRPANTLVIASSASNGAGAALLAAEQDSLGLIDGVAVSEPQIQPKDVSGIGIKQGTATVSTIGKPLIDYFTYANLYQPCAALSTAATGSPGAAFIAGYASNRCTALKAKGLLAGTTLQAQADEALQKLRSYGWSSEHDLYHASHHALATPSIVVTYLNTLGRFSVADNVCGFSFGSTVATAGATLGNVTATSALVQAGIFASGNGVPPTSGINLVYNDASGGAKRDVLAVSPSTGLADGALDGALCARSLVTGTDTVTGSKLTGTLLAQSERVRQGIAEVQASGALNGKPTVIVSGRSDTLIPVNHASRAYYGANRKIDGASSKLRYYEVTNAQHFDAFIDNGLLPGYDSNLVPLHVYFNRGLDIMYAHLKNGTALPNSQVIRTTPRGGTAGSAPALTASNLPPIAGNPAAADTISYTGGTVNVPE